MAITHKPLKGFPGVQTPILHKVVYAHTEGEVLAMYQRSYKDYLVDQWLKDNCRGNYYHSPGYMKEKFIQFEDDRDAMWFALHWA